MLHHLPRLADRVLLSSLRVRGYNSRRLRTSVGIVHALDAKGAGELPPLVVLHGLSAAGQYYESLMKRVRPHVRRVLAPDMPGHGFSELPATGLTQQTLGIGLRETLDQLLSEPAVIFGNSLGAAAAIRYATERPERVLGLVLAAPGGAPLPDEASSTAFMGEFEIRDHPQALSFVDRLFYRPHRMRHLLAWGVRQQFARPGISDLVRSVRPSDMLSPDELRGLMMPVSVIWGEADRVLRPEHRAFFEEHLPAHAEIHRLEEYGHVPHMTHPDELARRVLQTVRAAVEWTR